MTHGASQRERSIRKTGFTLVELLIVLPLLAMLVATISSAIMVVTRVASPDTSPPGRRLKSGRIVSRVAADLAEAISFSERSPSAVELTVPDRDGDGVDDKLCYSWSGAAGAPLLFRFNEQPAEAILDDVHDFALTYDYDTLLETPLDEELALLMHHDDAPGGHYHEQAIEAQKWCAQYIRPPIPITATKWKIKRARLMAKREGADSTGVLEIRITTAGPMQTPTLTILDAVTVLESQLDEQANWIEVDFTSANDLDPWKGVCLVVAQISNGDKAAGIVYEHGGNPMSFNTHWMQSSDGPGSWSGPIADKDMRFYLYGTYDGYSPDAPQFLSAAGITVQTGADAGGSASSTTRVLNPPEIHP